MLATHSFSPVNYLLRAFAAPSTPVLVSYGPGRQGEPIGLSNRMYGSVSAILLALAAGARVEVDERILADLAKHDPPEDVLAALRPRALNASSSSKGIVLDHRVRTAHSWQKLADWQPTDGFGSLVAGWNDEKILQRLSLRLRNYSKNILAVYR